MAKKTAKPSLPSDEFINKKKGLLSAELEKAAQGTYKGKRETVTDKLELIKDELAPLKDKGIPYTVLRQIIKDQLDLEVSEQTLRAFCQSRLGFPKKQRKQKVESTQESGASTKISDGKKSEYNASKALSGNDQEFD